MIQSTEYNNDPSVAVIKIHDLNKWYGDFHVLKDICLDVYSGEKIVIC
ncbi:MAG: general L-amino acid transport system ATP-binding protein, partial [Planctomycetota bacterium]